MTTKLRDLFEDACGQVSRLKHPNIDEFQELMSDVMHAAGLPGIKNDKIDSLDESSELIIICTSYTVRGCGQHENYCLPSFIIDAEDPVKAATIWGLQQAIGLIESNIRQQTERTERMKQSLKEKQDMLSFQMSYPKTS